MIYRYCISSANHFKNAGSILIYFIGFILGTYYLIYRNGGEDSTLYQVGGALIFALFFVPQLVIHLKYYRLNFGRCFYYNSEKRSCSLKFSDGRAHSFSLDDIVTVERYKSFPLAENRAQWLPWDNYNYSVFYLSNGQHFVVTSLIVPNMDLPLPDAKVKLHKRFYCFPFGIKEVLDE